MIALILAGELFLTLTMGDIGLPRHLAKWIGGRNLSPTALLFALMLFYIVLEAGIDLLWFGIFIVLVVDMAQSTPPVGFKLFVLQGMTRREIGWLAKVTLPFFFLKVLAVALIWRFQGSVTALPQKMG